MAVTVPLLCHGARPCWHCRLRGPEAGARCCRVVEHDAGGRHEHAAAQRGRRRRAALLSGPDEAVGAPAAAARGGPPDHPLEGLVAVQAAQPAAARCASLRALEGPTPASFRQAAAALYSDSCAGLRVHQVYVQKLAGGHAVCEIVFPQCPCFR